MLDPSLKEAAAAAGALTVVATTHGEVCALHKPGGVGVSLSQVRAKPGAASRAVCCRASSPWSPSEGLCVPLTCGRYKLELSKLQRVHTHAGMMPGHVNCMRSVTDRRAKPNHVAAAGRPCAWCAWHAARRPRSRRGCARR